MSLNANEHFYVDYSQAVEPEASKLKIREVPVRKEFLQIKREIGACGTVDPEIFFPDRGDSLEPAKRVCDSCEIKDECFEYAIETGERYGVWGGSSERQRRRIRKERALAKKALEAAGE